MKAIIPGKGLFLPLSLLLALQACRREQPQEAEQPVTITSFSPEQGAEGATVVLTGRHFDPDAAKNQVKFKDIEAPVVSVGANNTELTVTVPENAVTGKISVTVGQHTATSGKDFIVNPSSPLITSLTPEKGDIGTEVTITGNNFKDGLKVFFGNVEATGAVVSRKTIRVKVPATAITAKVRIMQHDVEAISPGNFYLRPVVSSFGTGIEEDTLLIEGTNFSDILFDNSVRFGNNQAELVAATATQLQVKIPAGLTDSQRVYVKVKEMEGESATKFFYANPVITSFFPLKAEEGAIVTIKGANFGTRKENTSIKFGEKPASAGDVISVSSTEIKVQVPAGATAGQLQVLTGNRKALSPDWFYLLASITDFSPKRGNKGSQVIFSGKNMSSISQISLSGHACTILSNTGNQIVATLPDHNTNIEGGKFHFNDHIEDRTTEAVFTVTNVWATRSGASALFTSWETVAGASFVIGDKIYCGLAMYGYGKFKIYDTRLLTWSDGPTFPTGLLNRYTPTTVVLNNKVYMGLGKQSSALTDWWELEPATAIWTRKENFSGGITPTTATAVAYNGKAYIGGAAAGFYEFDPGTPTGTWTKLPNTGNNSTDHRSSFVINNQLYFGGGRYGSTAYTDFEKFDPATKTITRLEYIPTLTQQQENEVAPGFSVNGMGYILCRFSNLYRYNPVNDTWLSISSTNLPIRYVQVVDNRVWGWTTAGNMYEYILE